MPVCIRHFSLLSQPHRIRSAQLVAASSPLRLNRLIWSSDRYATRTATHSLTRCEFHSNTLNTEPLFFTISPSSSSCSSWSECSHSSKFSSSVLHVLCTRSAFQSFLLSFFFPRDTTQMYLINTDLIWSMIICECVCVCVCAVASLIMEADKQILRQWLVPLSLAESREKCVWSPHENVTTAQPQVCGQPDVVFVLLTLSCSWTRCSSTVRLSVSLSSRCWTCCKSISESDSEAGLTQSASCSYRRNFEIKPMLRHLWVHSPPSASTEEQIQNLHSELSWQTCY